MYDGDEKFVEQLYMTYEEVDNNCENDVYFISNVSSPETEIENQISYDENTFSLEIDRNDETENSVVSNTKKKTITKKKNPNIPKNVTKSEKRLVEMEILIWDLLHENHSNIYALQPAWVSIEKQVPNRSVSDYKGIWKSLKDSLQYRRKRKLGKTGTSGYENEPADVAATWEFDDCMSFLVPMLVKYPRRTTVSGLENLISKEVLTTDETLPLNEPESTIAVSTSSTSNYSYAVGPKKKDALTEFVINISKYMTDFVNRKPQTPHKELQIDHLWTFLDKLFQKMKPEQVDQLNMEYVQLAFNMLQIE